MIKKVIITVLLVLVIILAVGGVIAYGLYKPPTVVVPEYIYDIRYDSLSPGSDEVGIIIYITDSRTGVSEYYDSIGTESLYLLYGKTHPETREKAGDIFQFSMSQQYIEGLSIDNKTISGKLIDPNAKQQIGHWTFDLDKKQLSEVSLNLDK